MNDDQKKWLLVAIAGLAFVALLIFAVSSGDDLDDTAWTVDELLLDQQMSAPIADTVITATFADDGIGGSGGCNNYAGSYTTDGDSISIGDLASTQMFCDSPSGTSDQESVYFALLFEADTHRVDGDRLILSADGRDLVIYRSIPN